MSIRPEDVYVGLWTNWSDGSPVLGATITLHSSTANLLTAFLAIYVSLAASYFWDLIAYAIHYIRQGVTGGKCHPILQQQQVVLRAGLPAASTLFGLVKLSWANRSMKSSLKNSASPLLLSFICAIGSVTAGIYSSKVVTTSPQLEVLLSSPNCYFPEFSDPWVDLRPSLAYTDHRAAIIQSAWDYSQRCYNVSNNYDCSLFVRSTIEWTTDWKAECPFDDAMCLGPSMQLDTGLVNSNAVLGLNSSPKDQMDFRKITTCAPITQENYTTRGNFSANDGRAYEAVPDDYIFYLYGSSFGVGLINYTWSHNMVAANVTSTRTVGCVLVSIRSLFFSSLPVHHSPID